MGQFHGSMKQAGERITVNNRRAREKHYTFVCADVVSASDAPYTAGLADAWGRFIVEKPTAKVAKRKVAGSGKASNNTTKR